ncbi:MAG: N-acetyltransferase [Dehalococcoidia bacterium]|nr:N-acetyltransferase [Dehalococcoidia bacterium]
MMQGVHPYVQIGRDPCIDPGAFVGYPPSRVIPDLLLVIGDNAKVRTGTIIYAGSRIGHNLETGHHAVIREENDLGNHVRVWNGSVIDYGCVIGDRVKIHSQVYIAQFTVIEEDVFLAPGVTITNDPHPGCAFSLECMRGPVVKRGAQVGANSVLLPHIVIGEYSVIGAGSVVTKEVPPFSVVSGNPARLRGTVDELVCKRGITARPYGVTGANRKPPWAP